jgi:hypothetical protein
VAFIKSFLPDIATEPLAKPSNPKYPHELLAYSEAIFNLKAVTTAVFLS